MDYVSRTRRHNEKGQTILLVAIATLALIAMMALAIDVAVLYIDRRDAQAAVDAAALAGAKAFVSSGYTSGNVTSTTVQSLATNEALYAGQQGIVRGTPIQSSELSITFPQLTVNNPIISVVFIRTGLPTFFARIWGTLTTSIRATAQAEAYNPSGGTAAITIAGVKPWFLANCNPNNPIASPGGNLNCPATGGNNYNYFVDPTTGAPVNASSFLGISFDLRPVQPATQLGQSGSPNLGMDFYPLDIPQNNSPLCPACVSGNRGLYRDGIQCFVPTTFTCGQSVNDGGLLDANLNPGTGTGVNKNRTDSATQCLIHQTIGSYSLIPPNDCSGGPWPQDCFVVSGVGNPVFIAPGSQNPNPSLVGQQYISRSDSVVSVPLFDGRNLCPGHNCSAALSNSAPIVGFLQLGIQANPSNGHVQVVILNASGCNPAPSGTVTGNGASSVPVRLIQAP